MLFIPKPYNSILCDPNHPNHLTKEQLKADSRASLPFEKYRLGEKALYIPAGFFWKYIPLYTIQELKESRYFITSDNGVAPFSMEAPAIRIRFTMDTDEVFLGLEKEKKAVLLLEALKKRTGLTPVYLKKESHS